MDQLLQLLKFRKETYFLYLSANNLQIEDSHYNDFSSPNYYIMNSIIFEFTNQAKIMDIQFQDIIYFLKGLGGISVIYKFILIVIVKFLVEKEWQKSLYGVNSSSKSPLDHDKIKKIISYQGLIDLHEKCELLETHITSMNESHLK